MCSAKKVVVIGGTSGIGLATAKLLQERGDIVCVTGRSPSDIQTASSILGSENVVKKDVAVLSDTRELKEQISATFGEIDLLFVNAGINVVGELSSVSEEVYDNAFAVNVRGPAFCIQTLAPLIVQGGSIVVTTSIVDAKALPAAGVYAATKAALRSVVRSYAQELLKRHIRVNAVSPGPINTPIFAKSLGKECAAKVPENVGRSNPMERMGTAEEVAKAVVFLGFDATYTTGAELVVDGGVTTL